MEDGSPPEWPEPWSDNFTAKQSRGDGVTAAWNTGCELAKSRWIVLLNNDVECSGPFVDRLIAACDGQPGIAGTRMRREGDVEVLEGWCFAFPRLVWSMLGGFDEQMKLYFSDTDFMRRAKVSGIPIHAVDGLPLEHLGHRTAHDRSIRPDRAKLWMNDRNYYFSKYS